MDQVDGIRCGDVIACSEFLGEMRRDRVLLKVARDSVVEVRLRKGTTAERPILQLAFGIAMIGVGLFALARVIAIVGGGGIPMASLSGLAMAGWGVWISIEVVRPGLYLDVRTRNDRRKLSFGAGVTLRELSAFVALARQELAIEIETDLFRDRQASYR